MIIKKTNLILYLYLSKTIYSVWRTKLFQISIILKVIPLLIMTLIMLLNGDVSVINSATALSDNALTTEEEVALLMIELNEPSQ